MRNKKFVCSAVTFAVCIYYAIGAGYVFAGLRFDIEPNTRVQQTPEAVQKANSNDWTKYTKSSVFRLGDGVVPRGTATFVLGDRPNSPTILVSDVEIQVTSPKQVYNNAVDYDSFQLVYKKIAYNLDMDDELFCRLISFVNRDAFLLFTWPSANDVESVKLLKSEGMEQGHQKLGRHLYIAKEFAKMELYEFLFWIDVRAVTKPLPDETKTNLVAAINQTPIKVVANLEWINADFHVDYLVMLVSERGENRVDIAGAPLRYHWKRLGNNELAVNEIEIFDIPQGLKKEDKQYRAIAMFQAAALLRKFKAENPAAFAALAKQVDDIRQLNDKSAQ